MTQHYSSAAKRTVTGIEVFGRLSGFIFGGIIIFSAFSAVLVVAMVQQQIVKNLDEAGDVSYQEAYYLYSQRDSHQQNMESAEKTLATLNAALNENMQSRLGVEQEGDRLIPQLKRAARSNEIVEACPRQFSSSEDANLDWSDIAQALLNCLQSSGRTEIFGLQQSEIARATELNAEIVRIDTQRDQIQEAVKSQEANLQKARDKMVKSDGIRLSFTPQERLKSLWLDEIFELPPTILPMLLTFFSGLFGSLLINLILLVYPGNRYTIYSGQHFSQHVVLGGLIAVAVYVVIGAGASVLSLDGEGASPSNYLTFSAIGLLAGMFSDKAADWLTRNVPFNDQQIAPVQKPADSAPGDET